MARRPMEFRTRTLAPAPGRQVQIPQNTAVGRGISDLGQAAKNVGQAFEQRAERDATLWAANAMASTRAQWTEEYINRENNAEGEAKNFTGRLQQDFDEYTRETLANAPSDQARQRLSMQLQDYQTRLTEKALVFEATKRVSYRQEQAEQVINVNQNTLLSDPSQLEGVIADTQEAIDAYGLPDDVARELKRNATEGMAVSAMTGLIDMRPGEALARVKGGEFDEVISPSKKAALINSAQSEIRRLEARARAERNAAKREYLDGFSDTVSFVQDTGTLPADTAYSQEQLVAALGEEDGQEAWARIEDALTFGQAYQVVKGGAPEEISAALADASARASTEEDYIQKKKELDALESALARREREIAEDALKYVFGTSPAVQRAASSLSQEGAGPEAYRRFTTAVKAEYDRLGVPKESRRFLTKRQAEGVSRQLKDTPEDEAGQVVSSMAERWGPAWPDVAQELEAAGIDPGYRAAIKVADDPALATRIVGAHRQAETLKKATTPDQELKIKDGVNELRLDLGPLLTGADYTGNNARVLGQITSDVETLARLYAVQGDPDPVSRARDEIISLRYHEMEGEVVGLVPRSVGGRMIEESDIEATGERLRAEEAIREFGPVSFQGTSGLDWLDEEATIRQAATRGVWVPNGTEMVLTVPVDEAGTMLPLVRRGPNGPEYYSFDLSEVGRGERRRRVTSEPQGPGPR